MFTVFFLIFMGFLYVVRDIILMLFVALLVMTMLEPLVNKLTAVKIPRALSVLLAYFLVIGVLGGVIAAITPIVVEQTTSFINALPSYLINIGVTSEFSERLLSSFISTLGNIPGEVVKLTVSIFSNVVNILAVLIFAFYMLLSRSKLEDQLGIFFGDDKKKELGKYINNLETRLGGWARGQMTLMFLVGLGTYIGFLILGIPFALPLAILAGIFEIIPIIGPLFAAIPAAIIGFGISSIVGFGVIAVAFLVQQLENYVLVPRIMEKSVGVSPIITLISIAIGARLAGVVGVIISVPMVIALQVTVKQFLIKD